MMGEGKMNTLLEFMTRTKGIEYLIAITLIFTFIAFWYLLQYKGSATGLVIRLLSILVLVLVVGLLAFFSIKSPEEKVMERPDKEQSLVSLEVLDNMYGPALLNHDLHKKKVKDCKICHHFSGERIAQCRECHGTAFNPKDINKPGLTHVYHIRCIGCHIENRKGPRECIGCHTRADVPPLSYSHPLNELPRCLKCHGSDGIENVTRIPEDHAGTPESVCQLCHKPRVKSTARAINIIPHDIKKNQGCLICHGDGIGGAGKVPADHAGRTDETCMTCHQGKGE